MLSVYPKKRMQHLILFEYQYFAALEKKGFFGLECLERGNKVIDMKVKVINIKVNHFGVKN